MDQQKESDELRNDKVYAGVQVMSNLSAFLVDAAEFYIRLRDAQDKVEIDSEGLSRVLTTYLPGVNQQPRDEDYSPEAFVAAIKPILNEYGDRYRPIQWGNVSHGYLRFIKSMGYLYLRSLQNERNEFAVKKNIPLSKLRGIDNRLVAVEELLNEGIFRKVSLMPLIVDEIWDGDRDEVRGAEIGRDEDSRDEVGRNHASDIPQVRLSAVKSPIPRILHSIPILNPELRDRCMPLLLMFDASNQAEQLDTVVATAVRVFEHRMRELSNAPDNATLKTIFHYAFDGDNPRLRLSLDQMEHVAGAQMYRGLSGYIRNAVSHRLQPFYTAERVLQIVGWIDFLLHRAESSVRGVLVEGEDRCAQHEETDESGDKRGICK